MSAEVGSAITGLVPWAIIAQEVTPEPASDIAALVTLVAQLGLSAIFLWQWRDERRERRELQETMLSWIKQFGPALEASTATLERVQSGLIQQVHRAQSASTRQEFDEKLQRLEKTADSLGKALREAKRGGSEDNEGA